MARKAEVSKEFMEAIVKYGDCPEEIFKMAKSPFERAIAVEFFKNEKEHAVIKSHLKLLEVMITAVFAIGAIGLLINVIPKFFGA